MKMSQGKKCALVLAFVIMLPLLWNQSKAVASAATPTFTQSTVEIVGNNEAYQLEIKDMLKGSTYKWSSTDSKVATVSSKGLVTAVNKGTATIKCKVTYATGGSKTLSCKITVTIPASEVKINNATEVNGAHVLLLGEKFNFNRDIVPSNSSDKTYWSIGGGDDACIRIEDTESGIITATKVGKVILVATAAKTTSEEDISNSIVNDAIIIEVVGPSASVGSAEIVSSTELKVIFDSPIDKNTVIDAAGKLLNTIEITTRKDAKGVMAKDLGAFTASLSADMKTMVITCANSFDGDYGINFTSNIKTIGGIAIDQYYKQLTFIDTIPPAVESVTLDDTGMVETIRFTEPIDFTNFKVSNAQVLPSTQSVDLSTISILNNKLNYIVSEDKQSLTINLSRIVSGDFGKAFSVTMSGIKDMNGNVPASYTLTVILSTDNTPKAQARLISVVRTSYYTVSAFFDRPISYAGWININGSTFMGTPDTTNNKRVNYTISDLEALFTGSKAISIGFWNSYNVLPQDTSANSMRNVSVDFTTEKTSPALYSYEFDAATSTLTLNYNEEVNLKANTGIFSTILVTATDDIQSGTNITYSKLLSTDNKVIKLKLNNMTLLGNYTFTLEQGFVSDNFKNMSTTRTITLSNMNGTTGELPGPFMIVQSSTNLSQIYLEFANKLDLASAQKVSNYNIPGVTILAAQVTNNTASGATVMLTVADGAIDLTLERPITITGVKGYNGSHTEIIQFTRMVELKDNKRPYFMEPVVYDKNTRNTIRLNFSEQIQGTMTVRVSLYNNQNVLYSNVVTISGNSANIMLDSIPANGTYLKIEVLANNITDTSGNPTMPLPVTYVFAAY